MNDNTSTYDPTRHHRRSLRLSGYDYARQGAYFVTVCTYGRQFLLGEVDGTEVALSSCGSIVEACWRALPQHFAVELDSFVVMPNHIHGILFINDSSDPKEGKAFAPSKGSRARNERANASPLPCWRGTRTGSLAAIVQNFKSVSTRKINQSRGVYTRLWQRNYYERVVRDEDELNVIRQYVLDNPGKWESDENNPTRR